MSKSIIITGAGRGIGKATADVFLDAGWTVGFVGRNPGALEEAIAGRDNSLALPCDVTKEEEVAQAFGKAQDQWGRIDAIFNNAGVSLKSAPIDEIDVSNWRNVIDVNLTGSFICAKVAFGLMRAQDPQGGRGGPP